jgi:hypothetical protein
MKVSPEERFWAKVRKGEPDECWEWTKNRGVYGYGQLRFGGADRRAHRVAYQLHYGVDPGTLFVCHRCDNPSCCNPAHLFLGTARENMADKVRKGRQARGERQGLSKLTADQVVEIRRLRMERWSITRLAKKFSVDPSLVARIVTGQIWVHVDGPVAPPGKMTKVTEADVIAIRASHAAGESGIALAARYGISPSMVSLIVKRKTWAHVP